MLSRKWKCLESIVVNHLRYVQYFLHHNEPTRARWEEKRYIFIRLSLQILAAIRELLNSPGIENVDQKMIILMIKSRREMASVIIQLLIELGPFSKVSDRRPYRTGKHEDWIFA